MFAAVTFVLVLLGADGAVTFTPGWHSLASCEEAMKVAVGGAATYTPNAPKRPIVGYCVAQSHSAERAASQ